MHSPPAGALAPTCGPLSPRAGDQAHVRATKPSCGRPGPRVGDQAHVRATKPTCGPLGNVRALQLDLASGVSLGRLMVSYDKEQFGCSRSKKYSSLFNMTDVCQPPQQLSFGLAVPRIWGGRRRGAGRKPLGRLSNTPHRARPAHCERHPVLVTLRARFRPLRSQFVEPTVRWAIDQTDRRLPERFRITNYTIQYDHMHLMVEAADKRALSSGLSSLVIRIARSVNVLVGRRGRFWADRWFGRELTSPRQVRTALVYVLANFRKHSRQARGSGIDRYSSARWFDGWDLGGVRPRFGSSLRCDTGPPAPDRQREAPVSRSRTWLGSMGWRQHGPLRLDEAPAGAPRNHSDGLPAQPLPRFSSSSKSPTMGAPTQPLPLASPRGLRSPRRPSPFSARRST